MTPRLMQSIGEPLHSPKMAQDLESNAMACAVFMLINEHRYMILATGHTADVNGPHDWSFTKTTLQY